MAKAKQDIIPAQEAEPQLTYYDKRMQMLGITPELNQVELIFGTDENGKQEVDTTTLTWKLYRRSVPVFRKHDKGIEIIVYSIDRELINYKSDSSRYSKNWSIIRYETPVVKTNGDVMKYQMPKGNGSYPFFPPSLLNKYENKEHIPVLFLTEGFFKAFKAAMHGADIIGLPSITHMKNKDTGALHPDILKLITRCDVKRVVWLVDGDCMDLSDKAADPKNVEKVDLYRRPSNFFNSICTFKQMLDDYDVEKYFFYVDTDGIMQSKWFMRPQEERPDRSSLKGLDDLLVTMPQHVQDIISDMYQVSRKSEWFIKYNISSGTGAVWKAFNLNSVTNFYLHYQERYKWLKDREFKFNGTMYKYDEKENECKVIIPAAASNYFRVGDDYYKYIEKPNKYKRLERIIVSRKKTTITDDHGKDFTKHIPKYEAFCNVPQHVNYQSVINNCFNVYAPLEHVPDEEECTVQDIPSTLKFLTHIFGTSMVKFQHPKTKEKIEYAMLDLAIDYVQLLYQKPEEKLPILCLVSKENNTGKSTFGKWLKQLFSANCAVVGNQDLAGDFNSHWATKLLVICDETKIDKQAVMEKVKSLSTADKIMMNAKGKEHVEIDCFIKFIFITNNEENFINISEEDIRYWIIKVPTIKEENPSLLDDMIEEIPAFLSFLNRRKLKTEKLNRMWMHPSLLKTEALKRVVEHSRPTLEKELLHRIKSTFFDFGEQEFEMSLAVINREWFNNKYESNYLERVLKEHIKVDVYYKPHPTEKDLFGNPLKVYTTKRYSYPKWASDSFNGGDKKRIDVKELGRPYIFKIDQFLTPEEIKSIDISIEAAGADGPPQFNPNKESLPF